MKKKILIISTLILMILLTFLNYNVNATGDGAGVQRHRDSSSSSGSILTTSEDTGTYTDSINPDDFHTDVTVSSSGTTMTFVRNILGVINVIGAIVLVATVALLGIKYVTGSLEERAEYKRSMIPIIIGAFLLFSTSTIINIVYSIVSNI